MVMMGTFASWGRSSISAAVFNPNCLINSIKLLETSASQPDLGSSRHVTSFRKPKVVFTPQRNEQIWVDCFWLDPLSPRKKIATVLKGASRSGAIAFGSNLINFWLFDDSSTTFEELINDCALLLIGWLGDLSVLGFWDFRRKIMIQQWNFQGERGKAKRDKYRGNSRGLWDWKFRAWVIYHRRGLCAGFGTSFCTIWPGCFRPLPDYFLVYFDRIQGIKEDNLLGEGPRETVVEESFECEWNRTLCFWKIILSVFNN